MQRLQCLDRLIGTLRRVVGQPSNNEGGSDPIARLACAYLIRCG